jgi:hypothetical protein
MGIRRKTGDCISTSPLHQAFSFLLELTAKNEVGRGHSKAEQSCDLLKYRPGRFQASLIAILKRRPSVIRVSTVSYLRREDLLTRYCLKTRMYVQQITEEKVWGCKQVRINEKSKEVTRLETYT